MSSTRRRVKLYVLNEERQWDDHGTGYVSSIWDHDEKGIQEGAVLLVRSDEDGSVMLESRIETDTVYQRQQDTLVVWSEADNDLALSFQEKEGCTEIWEKICQVQGKDPSVLATQQVEAVVDDESDAVEVQDFSAPIELPACELSKLEEISELCYNVLSSQPAREKLAIAIEQEDYVKKLIDIFHMCEDLENKEGLHLLFEIFKSLFLLEKNSLFEIMFMEENILDIVGVLENDPSKKEAVPHRKFLNDTVKFKEVIPISNRELLTKIHQTYRVQYIKDILVPVPSLFDENMSTLCSFLFFNKIQIVTLIQEDSHFLDELFQKLTDDEISDEKRKETVFLLRELCTFSQSLQAVSRDAFIKTLAEHGLLQSMEQLMNLDDHEMKSAIVDIICCVVDCSPSLVREYLCKEADFADEDSMLLNMLIDMLLTSHNGMGVIILQLIRNLLDPDNMGLGANKMEKSEFLGYFYRHCMHVLTAPIFAVTATEDLSGKDDFKRATVLDHIIDILTFCVQSHSYHIKTYIIGKDMLRRVLILMQSRHKFLALSALRFCRKIIGIKDEFFNRYIIVEKLFQPIVKVFVNNGKRYNLLNSAIIELFEFIRLEDIKTLCSYVVEQHIDAFDNIGYVETFSGLKTRYEQEKDRQNKIRDEKDSPAEGIIHVNNSTTTRKRRDDRVLDEYEESWFDAEDDEIKSVNDLESPSTKPLTTKLKDVDLLDNIPITRTESPPIPNKSPQTSPQTSPTKIDNPISPQNTSSSSPQNINRPSSPLQDASIKLNSTNGSPTQQNHVHTNHFQSKQLPGINNKPVINMKINTTLPTANSITENVNHVESNHLTNGPSSKNDMNNDTHKLKSIKDATTHVIKNKPMLTSLVDYPDDDEDSTDDDEIPSSPAKKQRIGST